MRQSTLRSVLALIALLAPCHSALAVVVSSTTDNTSTPDDTFPFNNVGVIKGASGVYLGDRWVLTARHVTGGKDPAPVSFPEIGTFQPVPNSLISIENADPKLSEFTDLVIFRLQEDPGLPSIPIASQTPAVGTEVYLVGNGLDRRDDVTFWDADITPAKNDWTEVDEAGEYAGYRTLGSNSIRWGTNLIEDDEQLFFEFDSGHTRTWPVNGNDVIFLITEFDHDGYSNNTVLNADSNFETEFESQAVLGDSGGGLFVRNEGIWELAGIINAVDGYSGQEESGGPSGVYNALFGAKTLSANLADYRDTILSHSGFQRGDFDSDGRLTRNDIDLLTGVMLSGVVPPSFDLNSDASIDQEDRRIWVEELAHTYFGDSNLDGQFNSNDLVTVFQSAHYEDGISENASWLTGDWNGDREFDTSDLVLAFQSNAYEQGARSRAGSAGPVVVPEPTLSVWLLLLFVGVCCRMRGPKR